ncbi:MAG: cupin domain-containing protein [Proteobacteria bacterium]|nr:cupin domain-containing protein [Pseudomonadota bacterium]
MAKQWPHPTAIDPQTVTPRLGSAYPAPYDRECAGRDRRSLAAALGLKAFNAELWRLPPGTWSSHRHWHSKNDELIYILEGELVLVTDEGERTLRAGMVCGFPAGKPDGHALINRADRDAVIIEIADREAGDAVTHTDPALAGT